MEHPTPTHHVELNEPRDNPVESTVVCVITRFGLCRSHHLLQTYLDFRRVMKEARRAGSPGLLRSVFLIEDRHTCYTMSLWRDYEAIPQFGTDVPSHVHVANRVLGRLRFHPDRGPELWSTKWSLNVVSNNLNWGDLDLRSLLARDLATKV